MLTQNKYLDDAYQNKLNALSKEYEAARLNNQYENEAALSDKKAQNRKAANAYMQSINPYGYEAEKRNNLGLNNSGITQRSNTDKYSLYQKNLGNNNKSYMSALNKNNNGLLQTKYKNEADKLNALGEYNNNMYDEYWRLLQQEYDKERDKVKDKQWEKEYKLKKKQNSL